MGAAKTVDDYLSAVPPVQRKALEKLRAQIHAAAPGATEKIAYGIPTFVHGGRNLVHMAAFKSHLSFYPGSGGVTMALAEELKGHKLAKGTIHFTPEKPIPAPLVKRIVKLRIDETQARAGTKEAKKPAGSSARKPSARRSARSRGQPDEGQ